MKSINLIDLIHRAEQASYLAWINAGGTSLLSPRKFSVLEAVASNEGSNQTELVEKTGIDRSTLADLIKRMEKDGLLKRERREGDHRAYVVKLGFKGRDVLERLGGVSGTANSILLQSIPPALLGEFESALTRLAAFEPWADVAPVPEVKVKSKGKGGRVSA